MCVIEQFHLIHPDNFRERKERYRPCPYGSPVTPCNDTRIVNAMDEFLDPAVDAAPAPYHQIIELRPVDRQRPNDRKKPRKIVDDIKLVFDFHIPFTSRKKEKKSEKKSKKKHHQDPRSEVVMGQPRGPEHFAIPPELRHQPPQMGFPEPGMHPLPPHPPMHGPPIGRPGGQVTPPITVHSYGSTDSSPSPLSPTREHQRPRARSLSLTRQYEERKRIIKERERREHAERIATDENAARLRAEREAERTRAEAERIREERDRERRRNEDLQAREQRRQFEAVERERRRRSQEKRERLAQAIDARQRREDSDRRAAEAVLERERQQLARRRRDGEMRQWRLEEERARLERQQRARIPRAPRHAAAIHHPRHERNGFEQEARENFEEHGNRVINDAVRAEQARIAERDRNATQPRWPGEGGPRRRRTIGAGERQVFDDDRRRWGDFGRRWF